MILPTTNRQRRARLAALKADLAAAPLKGDRTAPSDIIRFDMAQFVGREECGSVCCVAGLAVMGRGFVEAGGEPCRAGDLGPYYGDNIGFGDCAVVYLGVRFVEEHSLFYDWNIDADPADVKADKLAEIQELIDATPDDDQPVDLEA